MLFGSAQVSDNLATLRYSVLFSNLSQLILLLEMLSSPPWIPSDLRVGVIVRIEDCPQIALEMIRTAGLSKEEIRTWQLNKSELEPLSLKIH